MKPVEFLYLSQEDVIAAGGLEMAGTLATVEEAFRLWGLGDVVQPIKSTIRWGPPPTENTRGRIIAMAAYVGGGVDTAGVKWIPSMPMNPREHDLPRACALIILSDPHTGLPLAVMDGTVISANRTGAATGVAAKYLARKTASVLGLVGAGVQNRTQLLALCHILPALSEVRLFDLSPERTRAFGKKCRLISARPSARWGAPAKPLTERTPLSRPRSREMRMWKTGGSKPALSTARSRRGTRT